MTDKQKNEDAVNWIMHQDEPTRRKALEQLVEFAIEAEWLGVWDHMDRDELAEESGKPISEYEAPYIRTCGEPLGR